ncbi:MAG: butyrate kinase [Oligoflexia bacterium]|nr:butyrate kinase [Oligoflexia bacterium]
MSSFSSPPSLSTESSPSVFDKKILAINPGSTSTKVSLFVGEQEVLQAKINHDPKELAPFNTITEQKGYRCKLIIDGLKKSGYCSEELDAVVGRGGLLRPIPSGTYRVNDKMLTDLYDNKREHASNLGGIIAYEIAQKTSAKQAFIVDPVVVDEFSPLARYSGSKFIERNSIFHALNQKAVARKIATKLGKEYSVCNFVVAHMGGGISVAAHTQGRVVDNNNALDGEGPFSPERTGTLPTGQWLDFILESGYPKNELKKLNKGKGGLMSYLGTTDAMEIERRIATGDQYCDEVYQAMAYQISKEIGAYSTVLMGKVDRIILTGGLAYSTILVPNIRARVEFIAPLEIIPGENEMEALWLGIRRVLENKEQVKEY